MGQRAVMPGAAAVGVTPTVGVPMAGNGRPGRLPGSVPAGCSAGCAEPDVSRRKAMLESQVVVDKADGAEAARRCP